MLEPGDRPASNCPHGPPRAACTGPHRAIVRPDAVTSLWRHSRHRAWGWFVAAYAGAVLAFTAAASLVVDLLSCA